MTMTLIQQLRGRAAFLRDKGRIKSPQLMEQAADTLEAHLSQPAQAVDVGAIREVIDDLREWGETDAQLEARAETLTRALSTAQADGWRDIASAPENELVDVWVGSDETGFRYANAIKLGGIWCDRNGYRLTLKAIRLWHKALPLPAHPAPDKEGWA